jgi:hypothetical protein
MSESRSPLVCNCGSWHWSVEAVLFFDDDLKPSGYVLPVRCHSCGQSSVRHEIEALNPMGTYESIELGDSDE